MEVGSILNFKAPETFQLIDKAKIEKPVSKFRVLYSIRDLGAVVLNCKGIQKIVVNTHYNHWQQQHQLVLLFFVCTPGVVSQCGSSFISYSNF